jgi:hypothetical protein
LTDEPEQRLPQTLDNQAFGKKFESLEIIFWTSLLIQQYQYEITFL